MKKNTEVIAYIDMDQIVDELGIAPNWKTCNAYDIERCKQKVLSKLDPQTQTVELVGMFPHEVGMVLSAALSQRVDRLEWGEPRKSRKVIFDYTPCPELAL